MVWIPRSTSPRPSEITLPSSRVMVWPRSSRRSCIRSAALRRISKRRYPGISAMISAPRTALATAVATSSTLPRGTVSMTLPSKGFCTFIFSSLSTHSPAINIFMPIYLLAAWLSASCPPRYRTNGACTQGGRRVDAVAEVGFKSPVRPAYALTVAASIWRLYRWREAL